jgi:hypothetical protein
MQSNVSVGGNLLPTERQTHKTLRTFGRKPVTHWHRRERKKKRERERNWKGRIPRKRREGGHGSAEARKAEGQAEM